MNHYTDLGQKTEVVYVEDLNPFVDSELFADLGSGVDWEAQCPMVCSS